MAQGKAGDSMSVVTLTAAQARIVLEVTGRVITDNEIDGEDAPIHLTLSERLILEGARRRILEAGEQA